MRTVTARRSIVLALSVLAAVWSAAASAESLVEAYRLARQNDPRFRAAQFDNQAAGTTVDQARAGVLPTIKFDDQRFNTRQRVLSSNNPIFGAGVSRFITDTYTLSITQPLFRKDAIERLQQSHSVVRQAEYTLLAAEQDLMLRTAAAYLSVLAAADSVALARSERESVKSALDLAQAKLKGGLGTVTNLHDASARFAVNQAREIEAQNKLTDAKQALKEITGTLIENYQALRDEFKPAPPDPQVLERWLETAFDQNLLLRARRAGVEVARQEVERQRGGYYPTLDLVGQHNRRDSGSTLFGGGSSVETTDVILQLSVPIYQGGLTSAVTREALARYSRSFEEQEQERRSVERQTRAAYQGAVTGMSLVDALRQSVFSQRSALEGKEEAFKSGLLTLLPVLDAQRDLFLARRDYAQARYDYLLNSLKLKQAAGTLSEADLAAIATSLR